MYKNKIPYYRSTNITVFAFMKWKTTAAFCNLHRKAHDTTTALQNFGVTIHEIQRYSGIADLLDSALLIQRKTHHSQRRQTQNANLGIFILFTVPISLGMGHVRTSCAYANATKPAIPGFVCSVGYYKVAAVALSTLATLSVQQQ